MRTRRSSSTAPTSRRCCARPRCATLGSRSLPRSRQLKRSAWRSSRAARTPRRLVWKGEATA
eukprot:2435907-Prymnesium_polylepis.1